MAGPTGLLQPKVLGRLKGLPLVARRIVEGTLHGMHRSAVQGLSIEFAQHRPYSPGDELKHLDWQVLARTDRYVVRQYQQETNLRAICFVDCSASMGYAGAVGPSGTPKSSETKASAVTKLHYARLLAASLSYLLLHQGDSVGLALIRVGSVEQVSPRATPGHVLSICRALEAADAAGGTDLAGSLKELAAQLQRRSLILVVSDLLDEPDAVMRALGQVHHRGHEVILFQVLDPREIDFEIEAHGVTAIRDMETGEEFEAEPALIRDLVREEIERFLARIDRGARAHGLHLVRCRTDDPVETVLSRYLHQRLRGVTR